MESQSKQENKQYLKGVVTATQIDTIHALTRSTDKHLMPLANKPMVQYAVEKLAGLGIREIAIVVSDGEQDVQRVMGDGSRHNVSIQYITQEKGNLGIVSAIRSCASFLEESSFVLHLGDTIIVDDLKQVRDDFVNSDADCMLALHHTKNANQFGVPTLDDQGKITRIDEKPLNPASHYAVCGVYFYTPVVHTIAPSLNLSQRGVYEISEMHTLLIQGGYSVQHRYIDQWWKDRGGVDDMLEGNRVALSLSATSKTQYEPNGHNVRIEGDVVIDSSTVISGNTTIRGPVVIGSRCLIQDSFIGPYTAVGDRVEIHNSNIQNSIVCDEVSITTTTPITDSIIGKKSIVNDSYPPNDHATRMTVGDNSVIYL